MSFIVRSHFILYVKDQEVSTEFYTELLGMNPQLNVPGMTEFRLGNETVLGLMPESGIAKIIHPVMLHPEEASGIPRCELYLYVEDPEVIYERTKDLKIVSPLMKRNWGDTAFYLADPDGHIIAFAKRS